MSKNIKGILADTASGGGGGGIKQRNNALQTAAAPLRTGQEPGEVEFEAQKPLKQKNGSDRPVIWAALVISVLAFGGMIALFIWVAEIKHHVSERGRIQVQTSDTDGNGVLDEIVRHVQHEGHHSDDDRRRLLALPDGAGNGVPVVDPFPGTGPKPDFQIKVLSTDKDGTKGVSSIILGETSNGMDVITIGVHAGTTDGSGGQRRLLADQTCSPESSECSSDDLPPWDIHRTGFGCHEDVDSATCPEKTCRTNASICSNDALHVWERGVSVNGEPCNKNCALEVLGNTCLTGDLTVSGRIVADNLAIVDPDDCGRILTPCFQDSEGSCGSQGPTGATGPPGAQGPQGHQGIQGVQGAQGAQGIPGVCNCTGGGGGGGGAGPQGPQGTQGPQGIQGADGETGPTGDTGATGPQGEQGPPGHDGSFVLPSPCVPPSIIVFMGMDDDQPIFVCQQFRQCCGNCSDGIQNGGETGVDCGGPDCPCCCGDFQENYTIDNQTCTRRCCPLDSCGLHNPIANQNCPCDNIHCGCAAIFPNNVDGCECSACDCGSSQCPCGQNTSHFTDETNTTFTITRCPCNTSSCPCGTVGCPCGSENCPCGEGVCGCGFSDGCPCPGPGCPCGSTPFCCGFEECPCATDLCPCNSFSCPPSTGACPCDPQILWPVVDGCLDNMTCICLDNITHFPNVHPFVDPCGDGCPEPAGWLCPLGAMWDNEVLRDHCICATVCPNGTSTVELVGNCTCPPWATPTNVINDHIITAQQILADPSLAACPPGAICKFYCTFEDNCNDGVQNFGETQIDCGGCHCPACNNCTDGIQNGNETGIDCGGTNCPCCCGDILVNATNISQAVYCCGPAADESGATCPCDSDVCNCLTFPCGECSCTCNSFNVTGCPDTPCGTGDCPCGESDECPCNTTECACGNSTGCPCGNPFVNCPCATEICPCTGPGCPCGGLDCPSGEDPCPCDPMVVWPVVDGCADNLTCKCLENVTANPPLYDLAVPCIECPPGDGWLCPLGAYLDKGVFTSTCTCAPVCPNGTSTAELVIDCMCPFWATAYDNDDNLITPDMIDADPSLADCDPGEVCNFYCWFNDLCGDGVQNFDETGVDCGGCHCDPCPPPCQNTSNLCPGLDCPLGAEIDTTEGCRCVTTINDCALFCPNHITIVDCDCFDAPFPYVCDFCPADNAQAEAVNGVTMGLLTQYTVLGSTTVTNVNNPGTVLPQDLGLSPGTSVTGFPPGIVLGTINVANTAANNAQLDLTAAYNDAAGRSVTNTIPANLGGQTLTAGVYEANAHGPWTGLTGTLTLDGANDPNSVFIFQTDSALTTDTGSSIVLINGAKACNVYWQLGSSATLGSGSSFVGIIFAQASVTVDTGATVQGRAFARTGAVTLDTNVFTIPCNVSAPDSCYYCEDTVDGNNLTTILSETALPHRCFYRGANFSSVTCNDGTVLPCVTAPPPPGPGRRLLAGELDTTCPACIDTSSIECAPTCPNCTNGVQDIGELGVDCGSDDCGPCPCAGEFCPGVVCPVGSSLSVDGFCSCIPNDVNFTGCSLPCFGSVNDAQCFSNECETPIAFNGHCRSCAQSECFFCLDIGAPLLQSGFGPLGFVCTYNGTVDSVTCPITLTFAPCIHQTLLNGQNRSSCIGCIDFENLACITGCANCTDGILNGDETEIDCGGSLCPPCKCPEEFCPGVVCPFNTYLAYNATFGFCACIHEPGFDSNANETCPGTAYISPCTSDVPPPEAEQGFVSSCFQCNTTAMPNCTYCPVTQGPEVFAELVVGPQYSYCRYTDCGIPKAESLQCNDGYFVDCFPLPGDNTELDCGLCVDTTQEACQVICPTCDDGIRNQGEGDIDCGGPCVNPCILYPPNCTDNRQNGNESGVDCGGTSPCVPCLPCTEQMCVGVTCPFGSELRFGNYFCVCEGVDGAVDGTVLVCPEGEESDSSTCFAPAPGSYLDRYDVVCPNCNSNIPSCVACVPSDANNNFTLGFGSSNSNLECVYSGNKSHVDCSAGYSMDCVVANDGSVSGCPPCIDFSDPQCQVVCPNCTDGIRNQNEDAVDCGGPCAGTFCNCHPNGTEDGNEDGVDCGSMDCPECCANTYCKQFSCPANSLIVLQNKTCWCEAPLGTTDGGACTLGGPPSCSGFTTAQTATSGIINDTDSSICEFCAYSGEDPCFSCPNGTVAHPLAQPIIATIYGFYCQYTGSGYVPQTCTDANPARSYVQDCGDYDMDLGITECAACFNLSSPACDVVCPTCTDEILNQNEVDIDCGGPYCPVCPNATCTDGILNGNEEVPDCFGTNCSTDCCVEQFCPGALCPLGSVLQMNAMFCVCETNLTNLTLTCPGVTEEVRACTDSPGPLFTTPPSLCELCTVEDHVDAECYYCPAPTHGNALTSQTVGAFAAYICNYNGYQPRIQCGDYRIDCSLLGGFWHCQGCVNTTNSNCNLNCPNCSDGMVNGGEELIDCGGPCSACPNCTDGILNNDEVEIDCGGSCPACPTNTDGIRNGDEIAPDCGGDSAQPCCAEHFCPGVVCPFGAYLGYNATYGFCGCIHGPTGDPDGILACPYGAGTSQCTSDVPAEEATQGFSSICQQCATSTIPDCAYCASGTDVVVFVTQFQSDYYAVCAYTITEEITVDNVQCNNGYLVDCRQEGADLFCGMCTDTTQAACQVICPNCTDGIQNRDEVRIDCGGQYCEACACVESYCPDTICPQGSSLTYNCMCLSDQPNTCYLICSESSYGGDYQRCASSSGDVANCGDPQTIHYSGYCRPCDAEAYYIDSYGETPHDPSTCWSCDTSDPTFVFQYGGIYSDLFVPWTCFLASNQETMACPDGSFTQCTKYEYGSPFVACLACLNASVYGCNRACANCTNGVHDNYEYALNRSCAPSASISTYQIGKNAVDCGGDCASCIACNDTLCPYTRCPVGSHLNRTCVCETTLPACTLRCPGTGDMVACQCDGTLEATGRQACEPCSFASTCYRCSFMYSDSLIITEGSINSFHGYTCLYYGNISVVYCPSQAAQYCYSYYDPGYEQVISLCGPCALDVDSSPGNGQCNNAPCATCSDGFLNQDEQLTDCGGDVCDPCFTSCPDIQYCADIVCPPNSQVRWNSVAGTCVCAHTNSLPGVETCPNNSTSICALSLDPIDAAYGALCQPCSSTFDSDCYYCATAPNASNFFMDYWMNDPIQQYSVCQYNGSITSIECDAGYVIPCYVRPIPADGSWCGVCIDRGVGDQCRPDCPTCSDGIQNGNETSTDGHPDCGGPQCGPCNVTCNNGVQDAGEQDTDCGGLYCTGENSTCFTCPEKLCPWMVCPENATLRAIESIAFCYCEGVDAPGRGVYDYGCPGDPPLTIGCIPLEPLPSTTFPDWTISRPGSVCKSCGPGFGEFESYPGLPASTFANCTRCPTLPVQCPYYYETGYYLPYLGMDLCWYQHASYNVREAECAPGYTVPCYPIHTFDQLICGMCTDPSADACHVDYCPNCTDGIRNQGEDIPGDCGGPCAACPPLSSALRNYSVLADTTITNTGLTVLDMNLGLYPGTSVTGAPVVLGQSNVNNAAAQQAQADLTTAYNDLAGRSVTQPATAADLGGSTLLAGVYETTAHGALSLTGTLTLDGNGDSTSVFIFQTSTTLTTAASSSVVLINGATACNVYWVLGTSATLGATSVFRGTILAQVSITVGTGVTFNGRALARTGAVTLDTDTFSDPCA